MSERFLLAAPPREGRAELRGDEARHLARVLRASVGDEVRLFCGDGVEWPARIVRIGRDAIDLETGPAISDPPRSGPTRTIAVALPKGERQKWLVEKLTELGVDRLVPLETAAPRAVATLVAGAAPGIRIVVADPRGGPLAAALVAADPEVIGLVGPEGGFTDEELAAADSAGAVRASLGPHVLRVETAAVALAARLV